MWLRLADFLLKYKIPLLLIIAAITVFMGFQARKVEINYEFASAIPSTNPKAKEYHAFKKQFGEDGSMMVIGVQTDKFFDQDFFTAYTHLVDELKKVPYVENILSIPGAINLVKDSATESLIAQPLLAPNSTIDASDFKSEFEQLPFYKGLLYNPDTKAYLMMLSINKDLLNSKNRTVTIGQVKDISEKFAQGQNVELHYSGLPLIRTEVAALVQKEMSQFLIISLVLTAGILLIFFRSFVGVLASLTVVGLGVVWSMGTLGLLGLKINLLNALIPPLIVVIGIPNCVYFLNKYHTEYNKNGDKINALKVMVDRMGIVTLFTNITAAIGFIVFWLTDSKLLADFGLVAGLNIMGIFVISLIVLPAIFSFLPAPKATHINYLDNKTMHKLLNTLTDWVFNHRGWIYISTLVISAIALAGLFRIKAVGHIVDDLPKDAVVYQDLKFFEKHFRGVMPLEIEIDTKRKNGAVSLGTIRKISELTDYVNSFPEMGRTLSFVNGVKFARQAFYEGDPTSYDVPNGFDAAFLQPYLRGKSGDSTSKNSMFNKLVSSFMDSNKQKARVSISMADVGSVRLPQLLDSLKPVTDELFDSARYHVTYTGSSVVFLEGSSFIIHSLRDSLIYAFVMIFGCMIFLFRSWRYVLMSIVVNLIPLLITAGMMGWVGIRIKPSTVLVFSIALGITVDVTIRFLISFKQDLADHNDNIANTVRRTIHDTGISIIYTSLILVAGFGVFMISEFEGTKALGYLTSLTLLLSMVANLVLMPAMLLWMNNSLRKKVIKKARGSKS